MKMKKNKKQSLKQLQVKICKYCGNVFTFKEYPSNKISGHKHLFCNSICSNKFRVENSFNFDCIICGKKVFTQPAQIKWRNRKTCSMECKSKYSKIKLEKKRLEGKYTKHQLDRQARYAPEMKLWRISVFERDNYTCQICGIRGVYLEADHIKPFAYFPELRLTLENGRTLCRPCHNTTKIGAKKMKEIYGKK